MEAGVETTIKAGHMLQPPPRVRYGDFRVGLIVPAGNMAAEAELSAALPESIALCTTRVPVFGDSAEHLLQMADAVPAAAELVAKAAADLIVFNCTVATTLSLEIGGSICKTIRERTGIGAVTTGQAVVNALDEIGARRIVLISPYVTWLNNSISAFLNGHGINVIHQAGLELSGARNMAAVSAQAWMDYAIANRRDDADAYFISCAATRTLAIQDELSSRLGKPVFSSNTAVARECVKRAG